MGVPDEPWDADIRPDSYHLGGGSDAFDGHVLCGEINRKPKPSQGPESKTTSGLWSASSS